MVGRSLQPPIRVYASNSIVFFSNKLENLPEWISDCSFLKRLNVSHNKLQSLPQRIFCEAPKLKQLIADHNEIRELPPHISNSVVEEINLHHNLIESLPEDFLCSLNK